MRYIITLILWILPQIVCAQAWEDQNLFNPEAGTPPLRIISSTDTSLFAPVIENFIQAHPSISIDYMVTGTADINKRFRADPDAFDVVISSAMDLQLKLANDGYAQRLPDIAHPKWAQWHQSLFAFTSEPAAIVINKAAFAGYPIPKTRQELIQAIRARPHVFRGRLGTYDIRKSGLGYLFATQDARATETYWRLMEVMGALDVRLYCCSGDMIDDLSHGRIAVAYNVLGSYAAARSKNTNALEIILPADFPTTMMRTAMVSAKAAQPSQAKAFIQHLIALQVDPDTTTAQLPPLNTRAAETKQITIELDPALMTYLDTLKRQKFLTEWENAVIQD
ncbi:MAG: ABC transporter substrate-binding protein [Halocynthiibacter sp.]